MQLLLQGKIIHAKPSEWQKLLLDNAENLTDHYFSFPPQTLPKVFVAVFN